MRAHQAIERVRGGATPREASEVRVVINSYNRLEYLERQLAWLEDAGFRRILILDNASSYPPLLEFYRRTKHEVVPLGENLGPYALWKHPIFHRIRTDYYVYTDPDIVAADTCPKDFLAFFFETLARHPLYEEVGFGLRVDDLPACYEKRAQVKAWESQFWEKPYAQHLYEATVDTTFALYRPYAAGGYWARALRTAGPYQAHHLPWYEDSRNPSEEELYYRAHLTRGSSHWFSKPEEYFSADVSPRKGVAR
jgi:hypothetical protein